MKPFQPVILNDDPDRGAAIHVYGDVGTTQQGNLSALSQLPYVYPPIILLADVHNKPALETPSSSVIATRHRFSLALTSPSQNCGMSLIKTPIMRDCATRSFVDEFFRSIKSDVPLENRTPVLTSGEVVQALMFGAEWAVGKYALDRSFLSNVELGGNLLSERDVSVSEIEHAIPREIRELSRRRFAIIGGGNHFLELQTVEEILDDTTAKRWGLEAGQIVVMFHTGSDFLGGYLGRIYARRKKTTRKQRLLFFRKKLRYHLFARPLRSIPKRLSYYFLPQAFRFVDPCTVEGERALLAINCAGNFGFASRTAICRAVSEACRRATGDQSCGAELLYDCSHNSIYRESIGGDSVWAHRHNACRVYPPSRLVDHPVFAKTGQPIILPGTNQTSSFVCAGKEGAEVSHFTVDHGLGAVQKRYEQQAGLEEVGEFSALYDYEGEAPRMVPMLSDTAVDQAVGVLDDAEIVRPVVRLKPLATLKGPKSKIV